MYRQCIVGRAARMEQIILSKDKPCRCVCISKLHTERRQKKVVSLRLKLLPTKAQVQGAKHRVITSLHQLTCARLVLG